MKISAKCLFFSTLLLLIAQCQPTIAKCVKLDIPFYPHYMDESLPTDTLIFISVISKDGKIGRKAFIDGEHYLESDNMKYRLHPSQLNSETLFIENKIAVFQPEDILEPNTEYRLIIDPGIMDNIAAKFSDERDISTEPDEHDYAHIKMMENLTFSTSAEPAKEIDNAIENLYSYKYESISYGCGPSEFHLFKADSELTAPMHIIRIRKAGETEFQSFVVQTDTEEQTIYIGHGMCGGKYYYEEGQEYELTVAPMNYAGQIGEFSPILKFTVGKAEIVNTDSE